MYNFISDNKNSLSKKAQYLRLASVYLSESLKSGSYSSLFKGQGIEFSGVREYLVGDDVRSIDWNVTARVSKPYVKVFEEEKEMQIFLIVDRSISMFTGSKNNIKYKTVCEISSLLTFSGEYNNSAVGAVFFDGEISFSVKPEVGNKQTMLLLSKLDRIDKIVPGSVLKNAIQCASKILKKRSLVFVISDFRTDGWQDSFKLLCQKHDVMAISVVDSSDWELKPVGSVPFTDGESSKRVVLPTSKKAFKDAWKEDYRVRIQNWKDFCIRHGAKPLVISTEEDVLRTLSVFLKS